MDGGKGCDEVMFVGYSTSVQFFLFFVFCLSTFFFPACSPLCIVFFPAHILLMLSYCFYSIAHSNFIVFLMLDVQ